MSSPVWGYREGSQGPGAEQGGSEIPLRKGWRGCTCGADSGTVTLASTSPGEGGREGG